MPTTGGEKDTKEEIDLEDYLIYTPTEEYIPYPKRVYSSKKGEKKSVTKKKKQELAEDFKNVLSEISRKEVKDDEFAYFVLEFLSKPLSSKYERILNQMEVHLLSFLDKDQKTALVESGFDIHQNIPGESRDIIKNIRLLEPYEKLEEELVGKKSAEKVIINTVPNVPVEKILNHLAKVKNYINHHGGKSINSLVDKANLRGSLIAHTSGEVLQTLIENSDIVLSAYRVPKLIISEINKRRRRGSLERPVFAASSLERPKDSEDYEIIEIDSGARVLQEFQGKVISLSALPIFTDGDDNDNHGTPIASLIIYGELNGKPDARFKVRSYKAFQQDSTKLKNQDLYSAVKYVADSYNGKSRVYASSINFLSSNDKSQYETRKIDLLVQAKNICFVNSVGNICDAEQRLENQESHTSIWKSNKVLHPSDAPSITGVGAYSRIRNYIDGSYKTRPACFSRYGSQSIVLKPEVLEYGGTRMADGSDKDLGVKTYGINGIEPQFGTSFSAPLFARHLAAIAKCVDNELKNAETIKAIAYSACFPTNNFEQFCGLGIFDMRDLLPDPHTSRIIFEGTFSGMNATQIPIHELNIYIPVQPVEVTLILVHSDNYRLQTILDNFTAITVNGTKGQQKLRLKKRGNIRGWTHVRKEVYTYKANSVGMWRFRLKPRLDKVPVIELPNLSIRYGGVLVVRSRKLPKSFSSLKSAIEYQMKKLANAGRSIR